MPQGHTTTPFNRRHHELGFAIYLSFFCFFSFLFQLCIFTSFSPLGRELSFHSRQTDDLGTGEVLASSSPSVTKGSVPLWLDCLTLIIHRTWCQPCLLFFCLFSVLGHWKNWTKAPLLLLHHGMCSMALYSSHNLRGASKLSYLICSTWPLTSCSFCLSVLLCCFFSSDAIRRQFKNCLCFNLFMH